MAERAAFVDRLELFGIGYSWGGYESLAPARWIPAARSRSRRRQISYGSTSGSKIRTT